MKVFCSTYYSMKNIFIVQDGNIYFDNLCNSLFEEQRKPLHSLSGCNSNV